MTVRIYHPTKNAMQSGKGSGKQWLLEHVAHDTRFIEPLMGWTGNGDMSGQIKLRFASKDDAIDYAKREGLDYYVTEPKKATVKIQSYTDNFCDG